MDSPLIPLKPEELIIKNYLRGPFGNDFIGSFSWALKEKGLYYL
jgi:hypothetical protein